jgi:tRNA-guanine family transglycosylase
MHTHTQAANCTPAQVSVDTLYGRRSLTPAGHAALVARLRPTLAMAVMDEAPASASRTRQQKAVQRSLLWLDHLLRANTVTEASSEGAGAEEDPAAAAGAGGEGKSEQGVDSPKENSPLQPAQALHEGPLAQQRALKADCAGMGSARLQRQQQPFVLGGVVGGTDLALRRQSARETAKRMVVGSAAATGGVSIGGLGMGESPRERASVLRAVAAELPAPLLRVCVGLSTPLEVLDAMLAGGVDIINSPLPLQLTLAGHALAFPLEMRAEDGCGKAGEEEGPEPKRRRLEGTAPPQDDGGEGGQRRQAIVNLWDRRWRQDARPLVPGCPCLACRRHSRAYIHHLLLAHEMAGEVLLHAHNLEHYLRFFEASRRAVLAGALPKYRQHVARVCGNTPTTTAPNK